MFSLYAEVRNGIRRGKRLIRWLLGRDLLVRAQVDVATEQYGSDYGGWTIVSQTLSENSTIYSFGVGDDISFDLGLIDRYGVNVHAFDPTPRSIQWIERQSLPRQFVFHSYGIADYDGTAVFHPPARESYVSYTFLSDSPSKQTGIRAPVRRLSSIMSDLGDDHLDVLKMDIEGAEYDVLDDLVESSTHPDQLLVEFHHRFSSIDLHRTKRAIEDLHRAGYRIFHVAPSGEEVCFVHGSLLSNESSSGDTAR